MSANNTYLAVFIGSKTSPKMTTWNALPEADRKAKERDGMSAWHAWADKHKGAMVSMGGPLGKTKKGTGRGIAAHFGYGSYIAQVAEVSCDAAGGGLRVKRVVCAIDCGVAVNPSGVQAQMESAINFGLAATLKSAITLEHGRVQQSNFNDYEELRMNDAPLGIAEHFSKGPR